MVVVVLVVEGIKLNEERGKQRVSFRVLVEHECEAGVNGGGRRDQE